MLLQRSTIERSSELSQRQLEKLAQLQKTNFVEPGGTQIRVGTNNSGADAYVATSLVNAFYDAAAALDEKGVSTEGRVGVLNPRQYYELIQETGSKRSYQQRRDR